MIGDKRLIESINDLTRAVDRVGAQLEKANAHADAAPKSAEDVAEMATKLMQSTGIADMLTKIQRGPKVRVSIPDKPAIVLGVPSDAA